MDKTDGSAFYGTVVLEMAVCYQDTRVVGRVAVAIDSSAVRGSVVDECAMPQNKYRLVAQYCTTRAVGKTIGNTEAVECEVGILYIEYLSTAIPLYCYYSTVGALVVSVDGKVGVRDGRKGVCEEDGGGCTLWQLKSDSLFRSCTDNIFNGLPYRYYVICGVNNVQMSGDRCL